MFCRLLAALFGLLFATPALAQVTHEVVVNLWDEVRGTSAYGGVIQGSDGALYGVTFGGGPTGGEQGKGTAYRVAPDGTTTLLHEFLGVPNDIGPPIGEL